ncbi:MAG: transposase [Pirellula sp.]
MKSFAQPSTKFFNRRLRIENVKLFAQHQDLHGHPECGIQQQPAPDGLVKGNKIDTSIGAQIMVQKYMFHVPVYRTEDLFASSGWTVARGTLLNILSAMAYLFEGLYPRPILASVAFVFSTDQRSKDYL